MALDIYIRIDGLKGESTDSNHKDWMETVRFGETSLAHVATRLGTSEGHLLSANPQITDPHNLKVGQEIHLPTHPNPKSEGSAATPPAAVHATDLPKPPLGDPLMANMVKESLVGSRTTLEAAKLNAGQEGLLSGTLSGAAGTRRAASGDTREVGPSQVGQDIETTAFIVMMQASESAKQDLQQIMNGVKGINQAKADVRSEVDKLQGLIGGQDGDAPMEKTGGNAGKVDIKDLLTSEIPPKEP